MAILNKLYITAALMCLLMTSCYEDFEPKIDTEPALCLNALITAGQPIEVQVTHTWRYTDLAGATDHAVTDAVVSVYANGVKVDAAYLPAEGDHIKIVAESGKYGYAEGETTVPKSVPIKDIQLQPVITSVVDNDTEYDVRFNLNATMAIADSAATTDYYKFEYRPWFADEDIDYTNNFTFNIGDFYYEAEPIFSEHIGVIDAVSGNDNYGFTFFTDRQFAGKTYNLTLKFNSGQLIVAHDAFQQALGDCGVTLVLNTISTSYYNWCDYQWNLENGAVSELGEVGLGEPLSGYSNVSTGSGIIAAQATATYTVALRDIMQDVIGKGL